jgi:hypothetical protein
MKKILLVVLIVLVVGLVYIKEKHIDKNNVVTVNSNDSASRISESGITIELPKSYTLEKYKYPFPSDSFAEYNVDSENGFPRIDYVAFYSEASLKRYVEECVLECLEEGPDSPTIDPKAELDLYYKQKEMFNKNSFPREQTREINGRIWLIQPRICIGDGSCYTQNYITFINGNKIIISIIDYAETEAEALIESETINLLKEITIKSM